MEILRDLMSHSLGLSLRALPAVDRLHAAWPVVCGSALAGKGEVLHLDEENVLHIRVTDAEWRERFFEIRSKLRDDLSRVANATLAGLHFEQEYGTMRARQRAATPRNRRRE